MATHRLSTSLVCLFLFAGFWACQDHLDPSITPGSKNGRLRVKTLIHELGNAIDKVSQFRYDAQGRLQSVYTYQSPDSTVSDLDFGTYQYDAQNRLTQFRRDRIRYPRDNRFNSSESYAYTYNEQGKVQKIDYSGGLLWGYSYNDAGRLTNAGMGYSHPRFSIRGALAFSFTGDNLTQTVGGSGIRYQGMPDGMQDGFPGVGNATYTHDDKVNPFYGVFVIASPFSGFTNVLSGPSTPGTLFGGIDNVLTLSRNNVVSETPPAGSNSPTITYRYSYNADNLPTVRIKTTTPAAGVNNPVTVEKLRFEYESY